MSRLFERPGRRRAEARRASAEAEQLRLQAERREEQAREKEKMDAIAQLAGGIAHDFNNLLTVIGGNVLLLTTGELSEDGRGYAREIADAAERAGLLTKQLLTFSRKRQRSLPELDLNEVVEEAEVALHRLLGNEIEIVLALAPWLPSVLGDAGQLEQVLLNLAVNAQDAMPAGGTLTISTSEAGEAVVLRVADTGTGMDEETRRRAFEPFFTTKATGEGAGLGLSIVYGIVRESGGEIHIESVLGRGSQITVSLPRAPSELSPRASQPDAAAPPATGRVGRILIVDDEAAVLRVAGTALTRAGHETFTVGSALEALELLATDRPVDLLITDLAMPGMDGFELAERVCVERPGLPVLFMTGYSERLQANSSRSAGSPAILAKPFTPAALVAVVAQALAPS